MSCCASALPVVGGTVPGGIVLAPGIDTFIDQRTTTDGAVQTLVLANYPVIGAGGFFYGTCMGVQDDGVRGARVTFWLDGARNAIAFAAAQNGNIGPTGYTDAAAQPWTTVGVPVGWAFATVNIVGNQQQFQFNAAAGQTVRWTTVVQRILVGGATP